jgi:hypothetical protein
MRLDKKVREGRVHFVLPQDIGRVVVQPVETKDIAGMWRETTVANGNQRAKLTQRVRKSRRGGSK